jgi:hypothetical protein
MNFWQIARSRVHLHRHVGVGHDRHAADRRIGRVDRHVLFLDVDRLPLVGAGRALGQFPLVAEQQLEIAHVELGRVGGPGAFDAGGDGVGGLARHVRVDPAEALVSTSAASGSAPERIRRRRCRGSCRRCGRRRSAPRFPRRSWPCGRRSRAPARRSSAGRAAVDAFRVDVDQAHLHGGQRVFHRVRILPRPRSGCRTAPAIPFRRPSRCPRFPDARCPRGRSRSRRSSGPWIHRRCCRRGGSGRPS